MVEWLHREIAPEEIAKKQAKCTTDEEECKVEERDKFLAFLFMDGTDKKMFGHLMKSLMDDCALGSVTHPIAVEDAERYVAAQPELIDGTKAPRPSRCVVNSGNPPANTVTRLYLPIPPHYPDEVRARIWAQNNGYQMAPPTICTRASLQQQPAPAPTPPPAEGS